MKNSIVCMVFVFFISLSAFAATDDILIEDFESGDYGVEFFAENGDVSIKSLQAYEMKSIW